MTTILFLALLQSSQAEESSWTVTVDPLTFALGPMHIQVERKLADNWSLYATPSIRVFDAPWVPEEDKEDFQAYGVEAGLRYFPKGEALTGPWIMTRGVLAYMKTSDGSESNLGGYGSVLGGYTAIFADRWVLAGGLGLQYFQYTVGGMGLTGFSPAAHTNLGIAF